MRGMNLTEASSSADCRLRAITNTEKLPFLYMYIIFIGVQMQDPPIKSNQHSEEVCPGMEIREGDLWRRRELGSKNHTHCSDLFKLIHVLLMVLMYFIQSYPAFP